MSSRILKFNSLSCHDTLFKIMLNLSNVTYQIRKSQSHRMCIATGQDQFYFLGVFWIMSITSFKSTSLRFKAILISSNITTSWLFLDIIFLILSNPFWANSMSFWVGVFLIKQSVPNLSNLILGIFLMSLTRYSICLLQTDQYRPLDQLPLLLKPDPGQQ